MSKFNLHLLIFIFFAIFQTTLSHFNFNIWPFSSFSMYSENLIQEDKVPMLRITNKGASSYVSPPWGLLDVDYYKVIELLSPSSKGKLFSGNQINFLCDILNEKIKVKIGLIEFIYVKLSKVRYPKRITDQDIEGETFFVCYF